MDGVIVVNNGEAFVTLIRDLKLGDGVVTGSEGVRITRMVADGKYEEDFGFMESSVSSERRVELAVDRIAWDMTRIKSRAGKTVVVAGPVVVHTGGTTYLEWMAAEGYLSALLGGNAIAAHDIEQSMFGTSLGVDMRTGRAVEGGHRNHIAAINRIRAQGGIKQAVQNGALREGLFYRLIKEGIPFSLAGSIRDDGPLPETEMDLVKAQADYARLIKGADMILMLSSMLHSIGVGNMTPAGVKLVCVDINPAVVTKLADRGSLESVGIVTDVGLFLSLLVSRLKAGEDK
jgi:lysine-ketoglutarate reductase/saccharopine dehydrogenase-like protein (TIGR00300 family)